MLSTALGVELTARTRTPRALALTDHIDAPGDWLVSAIVGELVERAIAVVLIPCERSSEEILRLSKKISRKSRDALDRALKRGMLTIVDPHAFGDAFGDDKARVMATLAGTRTAGRAAAAAAASSEDATSSERRACVVIDGADSLCPSSSSAALERFLDAIAGEDLGFDVVTRAHGDCGTLERWIAESCDCEMRLIPLATGGAEDAQGMCETTHKTGAWLGGEGRRSRYAFAVTELGVRVERRSIVSS